MSLKRKIVLWGTNEKDERILVALELLERENFVNLYTFPEKIATEEFYQAMNDDWKDDKEVEFPEGYTKIERKLSASEDSLLPDEIRVDKPDLITRAQTEWHFIVLSTKLYDMYHDELGEFKEKVSGLVKFEHSVWDDLKSFWNKVQDQITEKNLFREHGVALREKADELFDKLKDMRKVLDNEFKDKSREISSKLLGDVHEIEKKVDDGLGLKPLFDELKSLQSRLNGFKMTRENRNDVWNDIDRVFKKIREKRGSETQKGGGKSRLEARYNGLIAAIQKMEKSIAFDEKDLNFQKKRVENTDGQLESQLRAAKIMMIEEKIKSKRDKVEDMNKTKLELEQKMEKELKKIEKAEKKERLEEAKETVKQKIASEIEEQTKNMDEMSEKLEKAASDLKQSEPQSVVEKVKEKVEDTAQKIVDSVESIAGVAADKVESAVESLKEVVEDAKEEASNVAQDVREKVEEKIDTAKESVADISEKIEEMKETATEATEEVIEEVESKVEEAKEVASDIVEDSEESIKDAIDKVNDDKE